MASANDSSKRRRLASPGIECISDLPNGVLTHVVSYLDAPSRPLFAASLAINQNAAASDERNTAIVDHEWSTLDFGDIEKDLAVRLTDGDISYILLCIDAVNKLKTLKLTNCVAITGTCLEPLRGSTMIEQIDLSLFRKNKNPDLDPPPPISCDFVVPILDSIIEREGCSLMHLQFPAKWRKEGRNVQFDQFLQRYDLKLRNRGIISCCKCSCDLPPENENWIELSSARFYGIQNYTCCECLKYYCNECQDDDENDYLLSCCVRCERKLCLDCQMKFCPECDGGPYCVDCQDFIECSVCNDNYKCKDSHYLHGDWKFCCKCERHFCGESFCDNNVGFYCQSGDCVKRCCNDCEQEFGWPWCRECGVMYCEDCNEKKSLEKTIKICKICDKYSCGECRTSVVDEEEESTDNCTGCIEMAGRVLMEENTKLRKEHEETKAENKKLKYDAGQMEYYADRLEREIKELKNQLKYEKGKVKELWRRK